MTESWRKVYIDPTTTVAIYKTILDHAPAIRVLISKQDSEFLVWELLYPNNQAGKDKRDIIFSNMIELPGQHYRDIADAMLGGTAQISTKNLGVAQSVE